jgi:hypothetical protein
MRLQGRNIVPLTLSSISSTPHSELADAVVAVRAREPRRRGPALRFTRAIPQQTGQDKMMRRRNCVAGDTYSMETMMVNFSASKKTTLVTVTVTRRFFSSVLRDLFNDP